MMDFNQRHDAMYQCPSAQMLPWLLTQPAFRFLAVLCLGALLVACGGGGSGVVVATPRFSWDANTKVLKDSLTGLNWQSIGQGTALTSAQRLPTVDELLLLTDKATLGDIPSDFSTTLLNNDLVFASDYNKTVTGNITGGFFTESRAGVWAVSFVSDDRGALYGVLPTDKPVDATAKQPVIITASSAAAFNRSRSISNYDRKITRGVAVAYDKENDLTWKVCSEPVSTVATVCDTGTPVKYAGTNLSQFLAANRVDGWRMPTKYELQGLLDRERGFQATTASYLINSDVFDQGTKNSSSSLWWTIGGVDSTRVYWTSTNGATTSTATQNFVASFDDGTVRLNTPASSYYVRLVRSGQFSDK